MNRRPIATVLLLFAGLLGPLATATPAHAVTVKEKAEAMVRLTSPTAASRSAWTSAAANQAGWAGYGFDWSTDYCTVAANQPMGFDFRAPCWRHDFGYRNYRAMGILKENKSRVDDTFYFDLKAVCKPYSVFKRPACNALAWLYYLAVRGFSVV